MAKPRITRLGDPANPYTKKKVTPEQARRSAADSARTTPKRAPASKPKSRGSTIDEFAQSMKRAADTVMKNVNNQYGGGARKRELDRRIRNQGG